MDYCSAKVNNIIPGSIAEEAGIEKGDCILSINNENISDVFDYRFLTVNEELNLEIRKANGEIWEVEIEKDEYEDLGIEFESFMMDQARSCTNKCIFCFVDQLPKGMRETLYFKDDDSRLSFLTGNYVTLTNISEEELERVIHYKLSPINISVHATSPQLRVKMLSNRFAADILERINKLVDGGITLNCQIVLCRGINDGEELDRTLSDLTEFYPGVNSISVVPVGLTRHRQNLEKLIPYDSDSSKEVLALMDKWQKRMINRHKTRIVYPADEFFIMAGQDIPDYNYYEEFPQIENGVGLIALLKQQFDEYLATLDYKLDIKRIVSIATGTSAAPFIRMLADRLEELFERLKVHVYPIENRFFGKTVTVTGLLTGQDIIARLNGQELGEKLLISSSMLRVGDTVFLDDYTVRDLESALNIEIQVVDNDGSDFINRVLGRA